MTPPTNPASPSGSLRPQRSTTLRNLLGGVVLTGALLAVGCGGDGSSTASEQRPSESADSAGGGAPLAGEGAASIALKVVADGSEVALGDVAAGDRPTLLWFWAPF